MQTLIKISTLKINSSFSLKLWENRLTDKVDISSAKLQSTWIRKEKLDYILNLIDSVD